MSFLLIFVSSLLAVVQSAIAKLASNGTRTPGTLSFNFCKMGGAFLFFALISIWNFKWHTETFVYACVYGVFQLLSTVFGYIALTKGPMAITSLICSYNLIIPCIYGVAFLDEKVGILRLTGFVMLAVSMLLLRRKDKTVVFKKHWALFTGGTFLCNGLNSVILKMHQTANPGKYCTEFICIALFVGFLVMFFSTVAAKQKPKLFELKFSVPSGIMMGGANFLSLYLSARISATVLFPLTTVFSVCINCILSKIMFKDKFTILQIIGIVLGVLSVIFIKG